MFAALVVITAICIIIRSRFRVWKGQLSAPMKPSAWDGIFSYVVKGSKPKEPTTHARKSSNGSQIRRLSPLSFLQGREGPKEWIPGSKRSNNITSQPTGNSRDCLISEELFSGHPTFHHTPLPAISNRSLEPIIEGVQVIQNPSLPMEKSLPRLPKPSRRRTR